MAISKDIVVDYGADPTGVANSAPAFYTGLKPDMAGEDTSLNIPAGTYKMGSGGGGGFFWATGMASLAVEGNGANLVTDTGGGVILGSLHMTQVGIDEASGRSARIQSVSAGANSVTLTPASASDGHISRAVVGQWMCVAGFDTQGLFLSAYGWPPNFHFLDFVQITAVDGDEISFTPALRYNYSDQWPEFNRGSAFEGDSGGPATVYFMHPDWSAVKVFNDMGELDNGNLIHCEGRDFTIYGGDSTDHPIYPSVNMYWRAYDHVVSSGALLESDKVIDTAIVDGGSYGQWYCQSSSNLFQELRNATFTFINGTAKNTIIDGCTLTNGGIFVGPTTHGPGETLVCRNTTMTGGVNGGIATQGPNGAGLEAFMCSMSNGIISIPLFTHTELMRVLAPDPYGRNVVFWTADRNTVDSFQVRAVTADTWPAADDQSTTTNITITSGDNVLEVSDAIFQASDVGKVILVNNARTGTPSQMRSVITEFTDSTHVKIFDDFTVSRTASAQTVQWGTFNAYIQTNQTGGFPSTIPVGAAKIGFSTPPVRTVTFENCTGTEPAVDLSQAEARNRPLNSYTKRQYSSLPTAANSALRLSAAGALAGTGSKVPMYGFIQSIKFNVTKAYTGAGTLNAGLGQFRVYLYINGVQTEYNPRINVKILGERVILADGSVTGTQSLDANLSFGSEPAWIDGGFDPVFSRNINSESSADWPEFTIEMITDQGFYTGPTAVVPLRFRLRAA